MFRTSNYSRNPLKSTSTSRTSGLIRRRRRKVAVVSMMPTTNSTAIIKQNDETNQKQNDHENEKQIDETTNNNHQINKKEMNLLQTSSKVFSEKLAAAAASILMANAAEQRREFAHATTPAQQQQVTTPNLYFMNRSAAYYLSTPTMIHHHHHQHGGGGGNKNDNNNNDDDDEVLIPSTSTDKISSKNSNKNNKVRFGFVEDLYLASADEAATAAEFFDQEEDDDDDFDFYDHHVGGSNNNFYMSQLQNPQQQQQLYDFDDDIFANSSTSKDDFFDDFMMMNLANKNSNNNNQQYDLYFQQKLHQLQQLQQHHHQRSIQQREQQQQQHHYENDISPSSLPHHLQLSSSQSKSENLQLLVKSKKLLVACSNQLSLIPDVSSLSERERESLEKVGLELDKEVSSVLRLFHGDENDKKEKEQKDQEVVGVAVLADSACRQLASELYSKLERGCCLSRCPILSKSLTRLICLFGEDHKQQGQEQQQQQQQANNEGDNSNNTKQIMIVRNALFLLNEKRIESAKKAIELAQQRKDEAKLWEKSLEKMKEGEDIRQEQQESGTSLIETTEEKKRMEFNNRELDRIRRAAKLRQMLEQQFINDEEDGSSSSHHHQLKKHQRIINKKKATTNRNSSILSENPNTNNTVSDNNNGKDDATAMISLGHHHYRRPSQLPFFVKNIRDSSSFLDIISAFKLNPSQLVAPPEHFHTTSDFTSSSSSASSSSSLSERAKRSLENPEISAETFDSGSRFLPLDAITVFASKYDCFINNTSSTNIHTNIDHGRKLIRRFVHMQHAGIRHHFSGSSPVVQDGEKEKEQNNNNENNNATTSNINFEAATEVSLCLADLLLRHCEAPTLATQLLNSSRPVFEGFLKKILELEKEEKEKNSAVLQQHQQDEELSYEFDITTSTSNISPSLSSSSQETKENKVFSTLFITKQVFKSKLASLRIRAACSHQPANWKQALDHTRALPVLTNENNNQTTTTTNLLMNAVSDEVYSALLILLNSVPAHALKPNEWLEFAVKFFPNKMMIEENEEVLSKSIEKEKVTMNKEDGVVNNVSFNSSELVEFKEEEYDNNDENDLSDETTVKDDELSLLENDELIKDESMIRQELESMIVEENLISPSNQAKKKRILAAAERRRKILEKAQQQSIKNNGPVTTTVLFSAYAKLNSASNSSNNVQKQQQLSFDTNIQQETRTTAKDEEEQSDENQQQQQQPASSFTLHSSPVFHQFCRVFVRSVEVHNARSLGVLMNNNNNNNNNTPKQLDQAREVQHSILSSLTKLVDLYLPHFVQSPNISTLLLTSLVSVIQARRFKFDRNRTSSSSSRGEEGSKNNNNNKHRIFSEGRLIHDSPTNEQKQAVAAAIKLLGPILQNVSTTNTNTNTNNTRDSSSTNNNNEILLSSTRSLNMTVCSLLSKSGLIGMWADALSVLGKEISATKKIADARTWSSIAHVAHRPHPANWQAALVACSASMELSSKNVSSSTNVNNNKRHNNNNNNNNFSSSSSTTAGDLEDIMETATAALTALSNSDIAFSHRTTLALQVFTRVRSLQQLPNGDDEQGTMQRLVAAFIDATTMRKPSLKTSSSSSSMTRGAWSDASELFSNFVRTRAVDVTSASRWLKNHSLACASSSSSSSSSKDHHRDADTQWRGRFAGKGRLGDEQRLTSSLVRALSSSSSSSSSSITSASSISSYENHNTAMMLCGGDGPALLRACAESGAWHCALMTLNNLIHSTSRTTTLAEKRRWVKNAALACLWAPKHSAYTSLQRIFPNAELPPLASADGEKDKTSGGVLKSYIARDDEPECDKDRFVVAAAAEQKSSEKKKVSSSVAVTKLNLDLFKLSKKSNNNNNRRSDDDYSKLRQNFAQPRTVASYEQQEIIDLTEKIYLMTKMKK